MSQLLFHRLKEQATILNLILLLIIGAFLFKKYNKQKQFKFFIYAALIIFLCCSTGYLPTYLAEKLELQNNPLTKEQLINLRGTTYIHVLGSGAANDKRLPANSEIGPAAIGRLAEGIRLFRNIDTAIIITSGKSLYNLETQASITKRAAIVLGVPENSIQTLDTPDNTIEEASDLAKKIGISNNLIIVTDAMHMPRALRTFKKAGFVNVYASSCNYKVHNSRHGGTYKWLPSLDNLSLFDQVLHEYLGNIKAAL